MSRQPVAFISHGSPMWAVAPGQTGPALQQWAMDQVRPKAILVISPHWMTRGGVAVMTNAAPATWHDFGGFSESLYALQYPAPGAPVFAEQAFDLIQSATASMGWTTVKDAERPFDHGAWVPLRYMFPAADIPVFQISLPALASPADLMRLGASVRPLRDEGVFIMATGSMTHNLVERNRPGVDLNYVPVFARWVRKAIESGHREDLLNWKQQAPFALRAHPSDDHFVPLFIAMGASWPNESPQWLNDEIQFEFLAMDAVAWGSQACA